MGRRKRPERLGGRVRGTFMCEGIRVPIDINPNVAVHLQTVMAEMQKEKYSNKKLEAAKRLRASESSLSSSQADMNDSNPPSKKRVTAQMVMSEQEMFQEELLKLQKRVGKIEQVLQKTVKVLKSVQERLSEHISLDSSGAMTAASSIASLGELPVTEKQCGCCDRFISDCKCFDDLYCWD